MLITTAFSLFFLFWSALFLVDFYLRTTHNEKYLAFVERRGFSVSPFQVRFYVNRVDNPTGYSSLSFMRSWSSTASQRVLRFLMGWFSVGAFVGLLCFAITPLYLTWLLVIELGNVVRVLRWRGGPLASFASHPLAAFIPAVTLPSLEQEDVNFKVAVSELASPDNSLFYVPLQEHVQTGITPVIPGVNIPWSHLPLFMFVLVIAGVFHELGHAIAAINANVRLNGFGVFLFAVYPGAFTELETDELSRSSSAQKLRIFTAGIWHNIILALVGALIIWSAPVFFMPFYESGKGVVVTDVSEKSGLYGANGFQPGHIVTQINQCAVHNTTEWTHCLERMHNQQLAGKQRTSTVTAVAGYLVQYSKVLPLTASPANVLDTSQSGEVQCCAEFGNVTPSHICFRYYPTLSQTFKPSNNRGDPFEEESKTTTSARIAGGGRPNRFPHLKLDVMRKADGESVRENVIDQAAKEKPVEVEEKEELPPDVDNIDVKVESIEKERKLNPRNIKRELTSPAPKFAESLGVRVKRAANFMQKMSGKDAAPKEPLPMAANVPEKEKLVVEKENVVVDSPKFSKNVVLAGSVRHACLPARQITDHASCEQLDGAMNIKEVPSGYVCVSPALYNGTALLRFGLKNRSRPVLFVGFLSEPLYMIDLMDITPRFDWIPFWFPLVVELFGKYLVTFSLAMALLNAVPCHGLDGQFMCETVVDYFCSKRPQIERQRICNNIVMFGTAIFCLNVSIGLIKFLFNYWR